MFMDYLKFLRVEAIAGATYLYNCLPYHGIENKFPIQILDSIGPPPIYYLDPFGCKVYIHIPDEARPTSSKLQPRATEGIFVGYPVSSKIFSIYLPNKRLIRNSHQLIFVPHMTGKVSLSIIMSVPKNPQPSSDIIINKDHDPVSEQLIKEQTQIYVDSNTTNPEFSTIPQPILHMPGSFNNLSEISEPPIVTQFTS
jgi:hypothetical protein